MTTEEQFIKMLEAIAEAASSEATSQECGTDADTDYWEKETERRIRDALAVFLQNKYSDNPK